MPPKNKHSSSRKDEFDLLAAGPLGRLISTTATNDPADDTPRPIHYRKRSIHAEAANALVVLRRVAFLEVEGKGAGATTKPAPLLTSSRGRQWAQASRLGLKNKNSEKLLEKVHERRTGFIQKWLEGPTRHERCHRRLTLSPEWRIAIGLGDHYGVHESGVSLHGTYGFPILPGSALTGVAAAAARAGDDTGPVPPESITRIFGSPRPTEQSGNGTKAKMGSVCFLDTLPVDISVHDDVITPHQKPYYNSADGPEAVAPGEHHQPEPASFLSLSGTFRVDLLGETEGDVELAKEWLTWAGEDIGIGGRTTAGYGYFTIDESPRSPSEQ